MKTIQLLAIAGIFGFMTKNTVAQQQQKVHADANVSVLQTDPEFKGGTDSLYAFLRANLKYPQQLKESGKGGGAILFFIVDKNGKIDDPIVLNGLNKEINEEAIRVVCLMPDWKPGTNGGMPVSEQYILPVYFAPATQVVQTALQ